MRHSTLMFQRRTKMFFFLVITMLITSCTLNTGASEELTEADFTPLATPKATFINNELKWDLVSKAETYKIIIDGELQSGWKTSPLQIDSSSKNGAYAIKAFATQGSTEFSTSEESTPVTVEYVSPIVLETPHISYSENTFTWDAIPNAEAYRVYQGNVFVKEVVSKSFSLSGTMSNGIYAIRAVNKTESRVYLSSKFSNTINAVYEAK